jgi:hypothetical protein
VVAVSLVRHDWLPKAFGTVFNDGKSCVLSLWTILKQFKAGSLSSLRTIVQNNASY